MKLHTLAFGLACGILWGIGVLLMGLLAAMTGYGIAFVDFLGDFYRGYDPTPMGSFIGLLWGFADGALGGVIFSWLYNSLVGKLGRQATI